MTRMFRNPALLLAAALLAAPDAFAAEQTNDTANLLAEIIRVDTSNPPGNEAKLAAFLKTKFEPLGLRIDIIPTPAPAKAHFIARLKGDGSRKPILLAAHADVVGVEREKWSLDPFGGVVKDGYVYGRGALDFKGGLAVFAQAVMKLARNNIPLARDVIFLSEADEEGGIYDTTWLAKDHFDKMKNGAILCNSGHFNIEIDLEALAKVASSRRPTREFVEEFALRDGRRIYVLGEGRLINLAAAEGHPASVMDMSFANQALSAEYMVKNHSTLEKAVYSVPENLDKQVAKLKLEAMKVSIDRLTMEQEQYLASWSEGT